MWHPHGKGWHPGLLFVLLLFSCSPQVENDTRRFPETLRRRPAGLESGRHDVREADLIRPPDTRLVRRLLGKFVNGSSLTPLERNYLRYSGIVAADAICARLREGRLTKDQRTRLAAELATLGEACVPRIREELQTASSGPVREALFEAVQLLGRKGRYLARDLSKLVSATDEGRAAENLLLGLAQLGSGEKETVARERDLTDVLESIAGKTTSYPGVDELPWTTRVPQACVARSRNLNDWRCAGIPVQLRDTGRISPPKGFASAFDLGASILSTPAVLRDGQVVCARLGPPFLYGLDVMCLSPDLDRIVWSLRDQRSEGNTLADLSLDHEGGLWAVNSGDGIYRIEGAGGKATFLKLPRIYGFGCRAAWKDGSIYVAGMAGLVRASASGSIVWIHDGGVRVSAGIVLKKNSVIVADWAGRIWRLDQGSGGVIWCVSVSGIVAADLVVTDRRIFVSTWSGRLIALDLESGTQMWTANTPGSVIAAPLGISNTLYVGTTEGVILAIDQGTGEIKWRTKVPSAVLAPLSPARDGIFVGTWDGRLYLLDRVEGKQVREWQVPDRILTELVSVPGAAFVTTVRGIILKIKTDRSVDWPSAAGSDGTRYVSR